MKLSFVAPLIAAGILLAGTGWAQGKWSVRTRVWRHVEEIDVVSAEQVEVGGAPVLIAGPTNVEQRTSGIAFGAEYSLHEMASVFFEIGPASATVTEKNTDGTEASYSFNDARAYAVGIEAGGDLATRQGMFWQASATLEKIGSADFTAGANQYDYEEGLGLSVGGSVGWTLRDVRVYAGGNMSLVEQEFIHFDDRRNQPDRMTTIVFEPKDSLSIVGGAAVENESARAFVELWLLGSAGMTAGISVTF